MTTETATYINGHHKTTPQHHQHQHSGGHHESPTSNSASSSPSASSSLNTSGKSSSANDEQAVQVTSQATGTSQDLSPLYDPNIKYPLENAWSFWFYKGEKSKTWKENVKFITTVEYVEDFWAVYNHLQLVSKINVGCDYMFFKKDVPPMWEDAHNRDGGAWRLNLEKRYHNTSLDTYWLNILLALVGDQFYEEGAFVNGVWVNVRGKMDKISLWTKAAKNAEVQIKIGNRYKEILGLKDKEQFLVYEEHKEADSNGPSKEPAYKC